MANVAAFESNVQSVSFDAGADLSSHQYKAVTLSSGSVVLCSSQGQKAIGILQNAPDASGKSASCGFSGIGKAKLGGSVSQLDALVTGASGTLITQADPDEVVLAYSLSDGSSGEIVPVIYCVAFGAGSSAVAERALAAAKIWVGNASGEAAAVTMSGDATIDNAGAVTVTDVTVGSDAAGDLLYKSSATALARLAKGTAKQVLAMNAGATAPEWVDADGSALPNFTDEQTDGGMPLVFTILVDSVTAGNFDVTVARKIRVVDVHAQHTGGAGEASDTLQVFNGANAITDAMSWAGADNTVVRCASIDDAYAEVAASGTLRVTTTDNDTGGDVGLGTVYITAIPVA